MESTRRSRDPEPCSRQCGWWCLRAWVLAAWLAFAPAVPAQAATQGCPIEARQPYAPYVFLGYACRDRDCAAHKAGFAWADTGGIKARAGCTYTGDAGFTEGCIAYAEDVVTAEQSGFEWARENEIMDECHCRGAGPRFQAGCEAYVAGFSR